MKLTIIGGGGVRVPLLVNGLVQSDLPVGDIALYDTDRERLAAIAPLAGRFAGRARLTVESTVDAAVDGADYVFTSIRVGGIERRAHDEQVSLAHGVVGQETVGPAGFAMAMRTVPPVIEYARVVERRAPKAWIINFTNPVGIVTQAVTDSTGARIIGICDTPTELFEDIAHALGVPSATCRFDYFGLNHLGWVREVYDVSQGGRPLLDRLWTQPEQLARLYRAPLFDATWLQSLRLLPTEYVYYYARTADAIANLTRAGRSRGTVIEQLNRQLFADLKNNANDPVRVYEEYLAVRDAGYMQIESGAPAPLERSPWSGLTGYDKIALQTVRSIHFNAGATIPLNIVNRGTIAGLEDGDVVEVPCVVGSHGARAAMSVGPMPDAVADLVVQVKDYERRTVRAALTGDRSLAVNALARNPLVPSAELADRLVDALLFA
ncbi:MAG: 6-phospho-beta-glucosidase [Acidobacteria bacterium]|nr:6-phospho-beta-glucosidase [Acidobacteriota bacterium]